MLISTEANKGFGHEPPSRLKYWKVNDTPESLPWQIEHRPNYRTKQVYSFKPDTKPLVFYCGGVPVMSNLQEPESKICNEVKSYFKAFNPEDYALIVVAEAATVHGQKEELAEHYNNAPQDYISSGAREFVKNALLPLLTNVKTFEEAKRQFSRVTLIGHSYGTLFIQNVSNALRYALQERTSLTAEQIRELMSVIPALNLGPTCNVVKKEADFTQLFAVLNEDRTSLGQVNYEALVADAHPMLAHRKIGHSNLLLLSRNTGTRVSAHKKTAQGWVDAGANDPYGHGLRLYMNVNHEPLPGLRSYQVNPSAAIARDFLDAVMEASIQSTRNDSSRDTLAILDTLIQERLTPAAKEEISGLLKRNKHAMRSFQNGESQR